MNENDQTLITITADIVAAHVSNNSIAVADLPALIAKVHGAFVALDGAPSDTAHAQASTAQQPAVSIRASVKPDSITCLCCGKKMLMLKRHLMTDHQLTVTAYKAMWKLPKDYPVVAPNYSARRSALALTIGLGRKPGQRSAKIK